MIKSYGFNKMIRFTQDLSKVPTQGVTLYLQKVKKRVQQRTPVKTGALREGWTIVGNTLFNTQRYAEYVEYGTIHQPAQLMLAASIAESGSDWKEAVRSVVQ